MTDIEIRRHGPVGRITFTRPDALNAMTPVMGAQIEAAIDDWRDEEEVTLIVIDALGDRAFCAGGDIALIYEAGVAGDFSVARNFWRDEYRLNAKLAAYPKPIATFMQGFTMGGGVGIGCHASHRIVGESSKIAMPECGIGLVPDVGGSLLLAQAPGACGEYLGTTASRMGPGDAIYAGFADFFVPEDSWPGLISVLESTGDAEFIEDTCVPRESETLAGHQAEIDRLFSGADLREIETALLSDGSEFAKDALLAMSRMSPLSAGVAVDLIRMSRAAGTLPQALELEYRATYRAIERGDFLEGIRAQVVDKDRKPKWRFASIQDVPADAMAEMLADLGENALKLEAM